MALNLDVSPVLSSVCTDSTFVEDASHNDEKGSFQTDKALSGGSDADFSNPMGSTTTSSVKTELQSSSTTGNKPKYHLPKNTVAAADAKVKEHLSRLNSINIEPGQNWFVSWYMVSSHFPLIAASFGPMANMMAVVSLVDPWKLDVKPFNDPTVHGDLAWIIACNAVSLACGCTANVSLLLNFSGRVPYNVSQAISISGFLVGSLTLTGLVVAANIVYDFNNPIHAVEFTRSQGYWYAIITACLYFVCFILLAMNELGHIYGIYGPSFNLNKPQRSFMLQNIAYVSWLLFGAGLFTFLLSEHVTYPDAIYFAQVTVLTIGFGDLHATSVVGRALCLPFALVGILLLGLIISSIRQMILKSGSYTVLWHYAESGRKNRLEEHKNKNKMDAITDGGLQPQNSGESSQDNSVSKERASFHSIREVHKKARKHYKWFTLFAALSAFMLFMGIGAMVFLFSEGWSYFNAIYFCALSVLTIGYGDIVPNNSASKAFFVVWSFIAVPTMTILVTCLLETIIKWFIVGADRFSGWAFGNRREALKRRRKKLMKRIGNTFGSTNSVDSPNPHPHRHRRHRHGHGDVSNHQDDGTVSNVIPENTQPYSVHFIEDENRFNPDHGDEETRIDVQSVQSSLDDIDRPGVENFDKRLAQVLDNPHNNLSSETRYLIKICQELDKSLRTVLVEPDKEYTFDEWNDMMELSQRHAPLRATASSTVSVDSSAGNEQIGPIDIPEEDEIGLNWLADDSPLRYPVRESRVFIHSYLRALENGLLVLAAKEVRENKKKHTNLK